MGIFLGCVSVCTSEQKRPWVCVCVCVTGSQVGLRGPRPYTSLCFLPLEAIPLEITIGSTTLPTHSPKSCWEPFPCQQHQSCGKCGKIRHAVQAGSSGDPLMLLPYTHLVLISKSSWLEWHISLKRDTKKS